MNTFQHWNHNAAYYGWIKQQVSACHSILDVGCGDGSLIRFLADGSKQLIGIDNNDFCISGAQEDNTCPFSSFICCNFEDYIPEKPFDAIIFVASIHHMDMLSAIKKAKTFLSPDGILLIVGIAKPSNIKDYVIEGLRVLPCRIISKLKHMRSSEDAHIPVSYNLLSLDEVRAVISEELPNGFIKQGLYYRYLVKWQKQISICR